MSLPAGPATRAAEQFDVFLTYSHQDRAAVTAIDVALRGAGLSVFLDVRSIRAGENLVARVFDGIATAGAQVIVLSQWSVESPWVAEELAAGRMRAIQTGYQVIPVLISECAIPSALAHLRYVDLRGWLTDRSFRRGMVDILYALDRAPQPLADEALSWAAQHAADLYQLDREFNYAIAHLDGGISEMAGNPDRTWMSYKLTLNEVPVALFLLDDTGAGWPAEMVEQASEAAPVHGSFMGGVELLSFWLRATVIPDESMAQVLSENVEALRKHLEGRGAQPWRKVRLSLAEEFGEIRDGRELRDEVRGVSAALHQIMSELVRSGVPQYDWQGPRFARARDQATSAPDPESAPDQS